MAEKSIGIRIQLNGLNTVISDIKTLEDEIRKAKEDLKQVEIGGAIFNQLSKEISQAETKLQSLTEASRGISKEKTLEGFGKLGAGISSSFAAATAAVSLFGKESESVQKAAVQAQNLLTIALSIRGVAEVKTGAQIVAKTIAEKAATAATTAANTATKAFYTTLAANPFTAIIAAVGLLVTAFIAFGESADEAAKKQQEFYDTVAQDAAKTIAQYETLTAVVNDQSISLDTRKKALDKLKASFPGYFKDLKDEEILNGNVKVAIDGARDAIVRKALANQYESRLAEALKKNTEERIKLAEKEVNVLELQAQARAEITRIENDATLKGAAFTNAIAQQSSLVNQAESELVGIKQERLKLDAQDQKQIDIITKALRGEEQQLGNLFSAEVKTKDAKTATIKATKDQVKQEYELQKLFDSQVKNLTALAEAYKKIAETQKIDIKAPEIVEATKTIVDARKALQDIKLEDVFKKLGIEITLTNDKLTVTKDLLTTSVDEFGVLYEDIRKIISTAAQTETVDQFAETVKTALNLVSEEFQKGNITKSAFEAFQTLTKQYLDFNKVVQENPTFKPETLKTFLDLEKQILIATGEYTKEKDKQGGIIVEQTAIVRNYNDLIEEQNKLLTDYAVVAKQEELQRLEGLKVLGAERDKYIAKLVQEGKLTKEQGEGLLNVKTTEENTKKLTELIDQLVEARIKGLQAVTKAIVQEENQIREFLFQVQESQKEGIALQTNTIKKALLNNLELVIDFTQKQNKIVIDEKKTTNAQLENLERDLAIKGIDITKLTEEEKLKILKAYLDKQKEEKDKSAADDKKRGKITVESLQKTLQEFGNLVNRAASVTAQYYAFQLKKLEDSNKKLQDQVVGDTEEANQKRIELESQYQKQKAEIEKRAAIKSLQFQLAQAIVDGAQAVLSVIEIPPLAIAVGALAAAQIAIIAQQLQYAQSLASGGRIRMGASGMVTGPSHENGGVMFAGGYNLEGGESIVNRQASLNYSGLLSTINQSGGGQPLINNASNSLMEERLLQAIAKQKNEPIRAYVISSEITKSQAINRKLDELSTI
jgi:hypothetical protein